MGDDIDLEGTTRDISDAERDVSRSSEAESIRLRRPISALLSDEWFESPDMQFRLSTRDTRREGQRLRE